MQAPVPDSGGVIKLIVNILAIVGFFVPVFAMAALWNLRKHFATRGQLKGAIKSVRRELANQVATLEKDLSEGMKHIEVTMRDNRDFLERTIKQQTESTCKDINGLGEKFTAVQKLAELAMVRADDAAGKTELIALKIENIDEHGTKAVEKLRVEIRDLTLALERSRKP